MNEAFSDRLRGDLAALREQGLYKKERVIGSPQGGVVRSGGHEVVNLCANNYLGLANHPAVRAAAQRSLDVLGYGMASVRFICGTQQIHKDLEARLARFLGTEDVILYSSCFDANGGLFETLLDERDAVISDALNHASIIDGIRLCKAQRFRYANNDMAASAISPNAMTRSSWSMTRTPPASWAPRGAVRPSIAASRRASTSSPALSARPWAAAAAGSSRRAAK